MFARTIENTIKDKIDSGKAIIVVGARQVWKDNPPEITIDG